MDAYVGRPTSAGRSHAPAHASTDDAPAPDATADTGAGNGVHPAWWHDVDRQSASAQPASAGGAANKAQPRLAYFKHAPIADPTKNGASLRSNPTCCSGFFPSFGTLIRLFQMICHEKDEQLGISH
jgi:hypothetical protein